MSYRTFEFIDKIYLKYAPKFKGVEIETNIIMSLLNSEKPCMISRFGSVELQALSLMRYWPFLNMLKSRTYRQMEMNAGFFPVTHSTLKQFYSQYKEDVKEMDLLITWRIEEFLFKDWLKGKETVWKATIDNFFSQDSPWTQVLSGKRILVVHPFKETIEQQYQIREKLFENPLALPAFKSLTIIKAVQSIAGNPVGFESWFDALEWMKSEIDKQDFDIALLGCGAYGMPLAAHIKRQGKKAVHMGGILQFLFGIKGKRFIETPETKDYINEYFVFPDEKDRPKMADKVEGGCYW